MTAEFKFVKVGYIVDGPNAGGFVPDGENVEDITRQIAAEAGDDPEDYTATEAFIKQYESKDGAFFASVLGAETKQ